MRLLESYGKDCFKFSENFLGLIFPALEPVTPQDTPQDTPQVAQLLTVLSGEMSRQELQQHLHLKDKKNFVENYLKPSIEAGLLEMTVPEKPNSRLQRYRLTGRAVNAKEK